MQIAYVLRAIYYGTRIILYYFSRLIKIFYVPTKQKSHSPRDTYNLHFGGLQISAITPGTQPTINLIVTATVSIYQLPICHDTAFIVAITLG